MMVMKNKLFLAGLFLMIGIKSFAQIDTLKVYLEKNPEHKTGVNLMFENNSNDTIFLFTRFHNISQGDNMATASGISIEYYCNNQRFTFNWGELPPRIFSFSRGRTLINPRSKVKLFFDIGYFRFPEKSSEKYEVSFLMNYIFSKSQESGLPTQIRFFETNRVTIVEPTEEKRNEDENSYEK
jgi:hypothetical protein